MPQIQPDAERQNKAANMKTTILFLILLLALSAHAGWESTYGGSDEDEGHSVAQTSDGGYIVAGVYDYDWELETGDVYLVKTDAVGDTIWMRTYGGSGIDWASPRMKSSKTEFGEFDDGSSKMPLLAHERVKSIATAGNIIRAISNRFIFCDKTLIEG